MKGYFIYTLGLFLCIISSVSSLSTLSYSFDNSNNGIYRYPTYYIGRIQADTTIRVSILAFTNGIDLSSADIKLVKGNDFQLVYQLSCSGNSCSDDYYISSNIDTYYSFRIALQGPSNLLPSAFMPFYLIISSYPGPANNLQMPPSLQNLLHIVDVLRIGINKYIYIDTQKTINITIGPIPAPLIGPDEALRLVATSPNSGWSLDYGSEIVLSDLGLTGGTYTYSGVVSKGYYSILTTYDIQKNPMKLTWQTDAYACNYTQEYTDYFSVFQGCLKNRTVPSGGYPCLVFDSVTFTCKSCIPSYYLSAQGACFANTTCLPRQYFKFGQCLDVNPLCGNYDYFTGVCLSCNNPNDYLFVNGNCILKIVTCGPRQYQINYQCYDVSSKCNNFDPRNGNCLSCLNSTFFTIQNGSCVQIKINCFQGQYSDGINCINIPVQCQSFDATLPGCLSCINGYFIQNRTCIKATCPPRFYASQTGNCVQVSSLCNQYDLLNGNCLSCIQSGYSAWNGQCIQVTSPLAGCAERQRLGFGPCANASINCRIFNLATGNCDQCEANNYLDYTGHCSQMVLCGNGQWFINGECLSYPQNCLQVDSNGLCIRCQDKIYRLLLGQCVYFPACSPRQYLNSAQQCVDVSVTCDKFNPSNGQCITCINSGTTPNQGQCCPLGQLYIANQGCTNGTVVGSNQQNTSTSTCLLKHPFLGFCLKCSQGYTSEFAFGGCTKQ